MVCLLYKSFWISSYCTNSNVWVRAWYYELFEPCCNTKITHTDSNPEPRCGKEYLHQGGSIQSDAMQSYCPHPEADIFLYPHTPKDFIPLALQQIHFFLTFGSKWHIPVYKREKQNHMKMTWIIECCGSFDRQVVSCVFSACWSYSEWHFFMRQKLELSQRISFYCGNGTKWLIRHENSAVLWRNSSLNR